MILTFFLSLVGFYILIKGADILVRGASSVAKILQISSWTMGVILVGIGTSVPEFAITFISAFTTNTSIGLGTVIGSNTLNILLILGLAAIIRPLQMRPNWVWKDFPVNILSVLIAISFVFLPAGPALGFSRTEGVIMFLIFLAWLFWTALRKKSDGEAELETRAVALPLAFLLILAGLLGVLLGGKWVVEGAEEFARLFGVSEALIGLTIVGIGTSLPELVVSAVAAWRKNFGIAVGNIIGSNIFDFLGILGFTAMFHKISFPEKLLPDIFITAASALLLFLAMFIGKKYVLKRWQGLVFIALYLAYLFFIIQRG
ncbi:calcium/sodium antiporter [Candidatus Giovannonibacteria bacterium]|nr:calcium/sodium antiporter [Candidatus Giovannonibacteria bacterium]